MIWAPGNSSVGSEPEIGWLCSQTVDGNGLSTNAMKRAPSVISWSRGSKESLFPTIDVITAICEDIVGDTVSQRAAIDAQLVLAGNPFDMNAEFEGNGGTEGVDQLVLLLARSNRCPIGRSPPPSRRSCSVGRLHDTPAHFPNGGKAETDAIDRLSPEFSRM